MVEALGAERRGQRHQAGVAHAAGDEIGVGSRAAGADDIDDDPRAAVAHARIERAGQADKTENLEIPCLSPDCRVDATEIAGRDRAGIVDEDVDVGAGGGEFRDLGVAAEIARMDRCPGAEAGVEIVPDGREVGFGARGEVEAAALGGECLGDGAADTLAGAGDDGRFAGQFEVHGDSFRSGRRMAAVGPAVYHCRRRRKRVRARGTARAGALAYRLADGYNPRAFIPWRRGGEAIESPGMPNRHFIRISTRGKNAQDEDQIVGQEAVQCDRDRQDQDEARGHASRHVEAEPSARRARSALWPSQTKKSSCR